MDSAQEIANDVRAVGHIEAVPTLLQVLCETTGMGFAAVARVTDYIWTACVVEDALNFGLAAGGQLNVHTTLCKEVRQSREPIFIDHASADPRYCNHHTPKTYNIESYVSVPIVLADGRYFGNLCAIDPKPRCVSASHIVHMFDRFAHVIALQLDAELALEREHSALLDERAGSELREQFIAVLGHDLRNPLSAISVTSELLIRRIEDPLLAGFAGRIKTNALRMSKLIDDVLDFARGRLGGGIGVTLQESDGLSDAINAVVKELQDSQPDRTILSTIRITRRVLCDVGRIQQVASNLLGNALTHGSSTGVATLTAHADDEVFELEVWNDGEPIPADKIGSVFGPFWRRSTSAAGQGLGLGLYICSEIVKSHGGTLSVTSTRETGTRITARIPLKPDQRVSNGFASPTSQRAHQTGRTRQVNELDCK
jgi:signal transduction histidine kinase